MPPKRARAAQGKKAQQKQASRPSQGQGRPRRAAAGRVSDADINTAFRLFAIERDELEEDADVGDDSEDEDDGEGVMSVRDVRKCLTSLKLPKPPADFFPASQTHISSQHFLLLAQALRESDDEESDAQTEEEEQHEDESEEAAAAFALFTHNRSADAPETRITLADLRRVARELREEVDEKVLKMMVEEANGGDASKGVSMDEFTDIMKRAGMLS